MRGGEIKNGEPQCKDGQDYAVFQHSQSLEAQDVWRMMVVAGSADGYCMSVVERLWGVLALTRVDSRPFHGGVGRSKTNRPAGRSKLWVCVVVVVLL